MNDSQQLNGWQRQWQAKRNELSSIKFLFICIFSCWNEALFVHLLVCIIIISGIEFLQESRGPWAARWPHTISYLNSKPNHFVDFVFQVSNLVSPRISSVVGCPVALRPNRLRWNSIKDRYSRWNKTETKKLKLQFTALYLLCSAFFHLLFRIFLSSRSLELSHSCFSRINCS